MRALLLQAMSRSALTLTSLRSEDIEGTNKLKVTARIRGLGRQDEASLDPRMHGELTLDEARAPGKPKNGLESGVKKVNALKLNN